MRDLATQFKHLLCHTVSVLCCAAKKTVDQLKSDRNNDTSALLSPIAICSEAINRQLPESDTIES